MPTSGQREFGGALLLVLGLLFYVGGAGYISRWFLPLPESWSERIGKVMAAVGAVLAISALV